MAGAIVALSALFTPVANAQLSYSLITGVPNPFCLITGPNNAGCGTQVNYVATAPFTTATFNATWSLLNNTAGASFVGGNTCTNVTSCPVTVTTSQAGSVVVHVVLAFAGGVQKTCQVTLTVSDTTPPVITCPPDVTFPCNTSIDPSVTGNPVVTDCSPFSVTFTDMVTGSNCAGSIITRTWTAVDSNGLIASCTQTLTPTSSVTINCPGPMTVQCLSQIPVPDNSSVVATNACGGQATVTHVGDVATNGQSNCNNVITRTYMATNGCGNSATCTQTFTVNDTTPPSITCPAPLAVQCFSQVPAPNIGSVIASDNCGGPVNVTFQGDVASNGQSNCNNVIMRTYQATDSCNNVATCTQMITVNDTTPPTFQFCAPPLNLQCFSQVPAANTGSVFAIDNCGGGVTITHLGDSASNGTSNCNNVISRTYQAVDGCGNAANCVQTIIVNDTTPPSISCPGPQAFQCFSQIPAPNIGSVVSSDNCGGAVTVIHLSDSASNGTSNCSNIVTRTYQSTDTCGNASTCIQTFTVNDTTPPSITCPGPVSVQCFSLVPAASTTSVTASDNCGGVTVTHLSDVASNGTSNCFNVITRTYQATDSCGNAMTCIQTITVNDTLPPSITCPGPVSVPCFSLVPAVNIGSVTASDNCGGLVNVTHVSDNASNGTSNCMNVITRTYQATDSCGNSAQCTQTITVNDTTLPSITCPGPVTVQCFSQVPAVNIGSVTASDNCGGLPIVTHVSDVATNGTANCNIITRTYRAQDSCGNQATCTQTITVADTIPPVITCPLDVNLLCADPTTPATTGFATATDNCDPSPVIGFTDMTVGDCTMGTSTIITRTWTATDSCNNVSSCVQIITKPFPIIPACSNDMGGGCGFPVPQLLAALVAQSLSVTINSGAFNAPGILVAQLPPIPPDIPLGGSCVLTLNPSSPNSFMTMFQTDNAGTFNMAFPLPPLMPPIDIRLQAGIVGPGPLGNIQLTNGIQVARPCPPCTLTRARWAAQAGPDFMLFDQNWLTVFPNGMDVGLFNPGNGNLPPNGFHWTGDVTGKNALKTFLQSITGLPGIINADAINPTTSMGAGAFARLTAVLQLNIGFNAAGLLGSPTPGFGAYIYINPFLPNDPLNGATVNDILAICNNVLSGSGPVPPGYGPGLLSNLLEDLQAAFDDCKPSDWADGFLHAP